MCVAALRLLDGDDTVLRDLAHSVGKQLANLRIVVGRDGSHLLNLVVVVVNLLSLRGDVVDDCLHCLVDTALQVHGVSTCGNILQALAHDGLCQDGSGCRAVAGIVASLRGHALHELCACVLEVVFKLHFLCYGHTVLGDLRCTKLLLDDHVTAFRAQRYLYCVSQLIDTFLQHVAGFHIVYDFFCHDFIYDLRINYLRIYYSLADDSQHI